MSGGMENVEKLLAFVEENEDICFCVMIAVYIDFESMLVIFGVVFASFLQF